MTDHEPATRSDVLTDEQAWDKVRALERALSPDCPGCGQPTYDCICSPQEPKNERVTTMARARKNILTQPEFYRLCESIKEDGPEFAAAMDCTRLAEHYAKRLGLPKTTSKHVARALETVGYESRIQKARKLNAESPVDQNYLLSIYATMIKLLCEELGVDFSSLVTSAIQRIRRETDGALVDSLVDTALDLLNGSDS